MGRRVLVDALALDGSGPMHGNAKRHDICLQCNNNPLSNASMRFKKKHNPTSDCSLVPLQATPAPAGFAGFIVIDEDKEAELQDNTSSIQQGGRLTSESLETWQANLHEMHRWQNRNGMQLQGEQLWYDAWSMSELAHL